jgi:hypothetical protein
MSLPKTLILLPVWGRKKVTLLCFKNLQKLKDKYNIEVLCVVSERWAKMEAFNHGFRFVKVSNDDLGHKMNVGIESAMKLDFEYLMNLGSDDIINESLFDAYKPCLQKGVGIFGITKATFIDSQSKEAKTCDYQIMIGAGRMIRKDYLEKYVMVDGKSIMYDKGLKCGLDLNSIKKFKCSHTEISTDFNMIWDIKGSENIWTYDNIGGDSIPFDEATKGMTTEQIDDILDL